LLQKTGIKKTDHAAGMSGMLFAALGLVWITAVIQCDSLLQKTGIKKTDHAAGMSGMLFAALGIVWIMLVIHFRGLPEDGGE